jgi:hypothetical protein
VSDLTAFGAIDMLHSRENVPKFGGETDIIDSSKEINSKIRPVIKYICFSYSTHVGWQN